MKVNAIRAVLLTFTNRETLQKIKTGFQMKINGKTTREMLADFQEYEIQIKNPVVIGSVERKNETKFCQSMSSKIEHIDIIHEFDMHIDSKIHSKKILFSQKKLGKYKEIIIKDKNIEKIEEDINNNTKENEIYKKSVVFLRKTVNELKNIGKKKTDNKWRRCERPHINSLFSLYNSKVQANCKLPSNKVGFLNISNKDNEYDFKICLHEIKPEDLNKESFAKIKRSYNDSGIEFEDKGKDKEEKPVKSNRGKKNLPKELYCKTQYSKGNANLEDTVTDKKQLNLHIPQKTTFIKKFLKMRNTPIQIKKMKSSPIQHFKKKATG